MEDCEKVTLTEKDPSPRSMVQGEGSSSHDQPVAITDKSVVIESRPTTPPPPQPRIRDEFRSSIMNEGGESAETGESSNNTKPEHKLQRVPQMLRQMETKKYYDPQLVSIGPYHHNDTNLKSFEKFKIQFTREFVKSCDPPDITELYNKVAELAGEARSCYAEGTTEGIEDTAFTEMMFLNGCFILQFVWCIVNDEEGQLEMMKSHEIALVHRDLFLLENQLPFQVLLAHSRKGKTRIASWIAEVMRDHFRSPWTAIAVLAALFAIFLTAVQTYFAAFPRTDKCQESICNYLLWLDCVSDSYELAMSNQASDKVTLNDEISSTRTSIVQGEESSGGSNNHDRPMAIADQHNVQLSVVIESHPTPQPQSQPQPQPQPQPFKHSYPTLHVFWLFGMSKSP